MTTQEKWFGHVSTLVYDPVPTTRSSTRSALSMLGFHHIECVSTLETFKDSFSTLDPDLVVADLSPDQESICQLVRRLRKGEFSSSPFAVVIAITWESSEGVVQNALNCGTDSLLLRPFSAGQLKEHIQHHIENRKPFVVTSDYIGPDRRPNVQAGPSAELIEVPNTLRAKAKRELQACSDHQKQIVEVRRAIRRKRIQSQARHVGVTAALILSQLAKPNTLFQIAAELRSMSAVAEDLLESCGRENEFTPIVALSQGLIQTIRQLRDALATNDPSHHAARPLALLTEFARAVPLALDPMQNEADVAREIAQTVERIRLRRVG